MKIQELGNESFIAVTVMRRGELEGRSVEQLEDGNVIPRLCVQAGELACAKTCQLAENEREAAGVGCAENNIYNAIEEFGTSPENFILAAATREKLDDGSEIDHVYFGDDLQNTSAFVSPEGYTMLPNSNGLFFRPGIDQGLNGEPIDAVGMRMADCGSVNVEMQDAEGRLVIGQGHFSRINMRGPSAFEHELHGEKVSWGEYFLGSAIEHYGTDPSTVKIKLAAAIEGPDFLHHYDTHERMEGHFPGWDELGFMHPEGGETNDFDCEIDYRQMIEWQIRQAADSFGLLRRNMDLFGAINTGDKSLGHASHHWATKGDISHGRDMYVTGVTSKLRNEQHEKYFDKAATNLAIGKIVGLPLEAGMPDIDPEDPFVSLYEISSGHPAPPKELWDTEENNVSAKADGYHPMAYWLMGSDVPDNPKLQSMYDDWMRVVHENKK